MQAREQVPLEKLYQLRDNVFNETIKTIAGNLAEAGVTIKRNRSTVVADNSMYYYLYKGEEERYDEEGFNSYPAPKRVGEIFQPGNSEGRVLTFRVSNDERDVVERLKKSLPSNIIHRIVESDKFTDLLLYPSMTDQERQKLLQPAGTFNENRIGFFQGQWVIVSGRDEQHVFASAGQSNDACRYYLLYDPIKKVAAATHLDFPPKEVEIAYRIHPPRDKEVIEEMITGLKDFGVDRKNLKLFASKNSPIETDLKSQFPDSTFELDDQFIFDASTGSFKEFEDENLYENESFRAINDADSQFEAMEIRFKHHIPHVLAYRSKTT